MSPGADTATDPILMLVDGKPSATMPVLDRGLHYGDGLFETIACRHGRPRFLDLHLQRLTDGCTRLRLHHEDFATLTAQIRAVAAAAQASIIKLILTRGNATTRGYRAHGDERARVVLLQYAWPTEDPRCWEQGVAVRTASGRYGENPSLAGLKHLNRLEQVLIRGEWSDPAIHEAMVFSSCGWLVSGTMSNVFLVADGRLMTPAITGAGIRGVMRGVVLGEAARRGLESAELPLDAAALDAAEEIFLTNARIGIWPVRSLDGHGRLVGPVTRQLQHWLLPLLETAHA